MTSSAIVLVIQRSAIESYEKCPRLRYLGYEWEGRGLEPVRRQLALEAGGAIHVGLQVLLTTGSIEMAVRQAINVYDVNLAGQVSEGHIDMTLYEGQSPQRTVDEHRALTEALLRSFAAVELQPFLAEYEVVAVEREVSESFRVGGVSLRLLARVDVLVKRRADSRLFVLNFKTASQLGKKWRMTMTHSMQTISEVIAAEREYGVLGGVLIYGLAKGNRQEYPVGSGNWYHNSPLIWAWAREGMAVGGAEWAARYAWADDSGSHRLGKGYRKVSVWDTYPGGVKAWIARLSAEDSQLLQEQFVLLPAITRQAADADEWKDSVLPREVRIAESAAYVRATSAGSTAAVDLNQHFPRHTSGGNCVWPSQCSMYEICWGAAGADPVGSGLYQLRQANHPAERELRSWSEEVIE